MTKQLLTLALLAGFGQGLLCSPLLADEQADKEQEKTIEETLEKIVFIPHDVGAPGVTDAGGVRSISALPNLDVLAPRSLSRSLSPAPVLFWYVSKKTGTSVRFTLTGDDPKAAEPLLDVDLGIYPKAGIYPIPLESFGVTLEADQRYSWSVGLMPAPGDVVGRPIAETWFEHSPSSDIDTFIATMSPLDQITYLARQGYWYDAIDIVSDRIQNDDRSEPWHEIRAHLLDQVGLQQAAAFDRQQSPQ